MYVVDITEKALPVEYEKFKLPSIGEYPLCILGYEIKNLFDQRHYIINRRFKPKNILHFTKLPSIAPVFLRGLIITPNNKLNTLINDLIIFRQTSFEAITQSTYTKYLQKYNLNCKQALNNLQDGVYPIDSEYLSCVTEDKNILDTLYKDMMRDTYIPSYLKLRYYKIFILLNHGVKIPSLY